MEGADALTERLEIVSQVGATLTKGCPSCGNDMFKLQVRPGTGECFVCARCGAVYVPG